MGEAITHVGEKAADALHSVVGALGIGDEHRELQLLRRARMKPKWCGAPSDDTAPSDDPTRNPPRASRPEPHGRLERASLC